MRYFPIYSDLYRPFLTGSSETFNQFFYRKLKVDARPVEEPENSDRLVSAADCRLMAFETVNEATRLWIKGREFTVARLLGDAYKSQAERFNGGALLIFRLAPQDYHRFHSPVDGTVGPMTYISGEYYTVNVSFRLGSPHVKQLIKLVLVVAAASYSDHSRRLRRECEEDYTNRQSPVRQSHGCVHRCHDGWEYLDDCERRARDQAR